MVLFEAACAFVIFLFLLYRYLTATYTFWKKRGVPGPEPVLFFGTMKNLMLSKEFSGTFWKRIYETYEDAKFVGLFNKRQPILLLKDPKLIKDVFIKDSAMFPSRGMMPEYMNAEPLQQFLFFLDGPIAVSLRTKVSPAFTPSKVKEMFSMMQECVVRMENYMDVLLEKSNCVNITDVAIRFTADMIGSCFIGTDLKTLSIEENGGSEVLHFRELIQKTKAKEMIKLLMRELFPQLYNAIGYHLFDNGTIANYYTRFILDLMEYRKKHNIVKSDFIGLLMEVRDNPKELGDEMDNKFQITDHFYGAQIFGFFQAGHESSAMVINNTLYELALNHNIQDILREEIQNFYAKNGVPTYDNINSMPYLNKVFKETTRKYPGADAVGRAAAATYTFKNTNVTIPKGQIIIIPIYAIHHNPKIYPKPEVYDPERFSDEAIRSRDPMHHAPFGHGIKNCIGERLGLLQAKLGIVTFLRKYKVDICEKTITSYIYRPQLFILLPADPIYLKITKLD